VPGKPHICTVPARLGLNESALSGDWTMGKRPPTLNAANGQIACRFHARDLNLVMRPAGPGTPARCRVLIDGHALLALASKPDTSSTPADLAQFARFAPV
jgi:Thioredoxin like C-terminal domain